MVQLEYDIICKFLVEQRGYPRDALMKPMDLDFLQKGLIIDADNGNILKLNFDGVIGKAAHGTKFLSDAEIVEIYGKERRWTVTDQFVENMHSTWNGPLSEKMRTCFDYFDMSVSLIFARMVDHIDAHNEDGKYEVWPDILAGLRYMYERSHFAEQKGEYFVHIKHQTEKYVHPASPDLLRWLKELKEKKITFLITGSFIDFANCTATAALGENWRDYFDFVVCYARKPGFFTGGRPFCKLDGFNELDAVEPHELQLNQVYSQGNWRDMMPLLAKSEKNKAGKNPMKCLYFGDNMLQDVYTPAKYTKCDTVSVVEEMLGEGMKGFDELHSDCVLLCSKKWGSFFANDGKTRTLWADIIESNSKVCVPSVELFSKYPLDHTFYSFTENEHSKGYYPGDPIHIIK